MSSMVHHISNTAHAAGTAAFHALPENVQHNIKVGTQNIKQGVHNAHKMASKAAHTAYKMSKQIAYDIAIGVFVLLLVILIIVLFSVSFQKSITKNNLTLNENLTVSGSTTISENATINGTATIQNLTVNGTFTTDTKVATTTTTYPILTIDGASGTTNSVNLTCTDANTLSINSSATVGAGAVNCGALTTSGNITCGDIICDDITSSGTITIGTSSSNSVELSCTSSGVMGVDSINCPSFSLSGNYISSATSVINISTGSIGLFNTSGDAVTLECSDSSVFTVGGAVICTNITIGTSPNAVSLSCTTGGVMSVSEISCPSFSLSGNYISSDTGVINISTGYIGLFNTSGDAVTLECSSSGVLTVGGAVYSGTALLTSDYRLKEEVEPISDAYSIDRLKPCSYLLKDDKSKKLQTGFIAHELQEIFPHLVNGEKDGEEMQSVNYIGLIAILTKELQSLKSVVAELKADNIELKADNIELKSDNIELKADNIELKTRIINLEKHF